MCDIPLVHSLVKLSELVRDCGEELPELPYALQLLDPFGVQLRYGIEISLTSEARDAMRSTVAVLRAFVMERVVVLDSGQ